MEEEKLLSQKLFNSAQAALRFALPASDGESAEEPSAQDNVDLANTGGTATNREIFADVLPSAADRQDVVQRVAHAVAPLATQPEAVLRIFDQVRGRLHLPGGSNRGRVERSVLRQVASFPAIVKDVKDGSMAICAAVMACAPHPKEGLKQAFADVCLPGRKRFVDALAKRRVNLRDSKRAQGGLFMPKKKPRGILVSWEVKQSAYDCWIRQSRPRMERTQGRQPRVTQPTLCNHATYLIAPTHARNSSEHKRV